MGAAAMAATVAEEETVERELDITADELRAEFAAALGVTVFEVDPHALTAVEMAEMLGCSAVTARRHIRTALKAGRLEKVQKWTTAMDGRQIRVAAYRVTK